MNQYRRFTVEMVGEVAVCTLHDRKVIDAANIQEMGDELFHLVEHENRVHLVVDFCNVEFYASAALNKLTILVNRKLPPRNGRLVLCGLRSEIYEVFVITRLHQLFTICDTKDQALLLWPQTATA